jgi:hypothetical protein
MSAFGWRPLRPSAVAAAENEMLGTQVLHQIKSRPPFALRAREAATSMITCSSPASLLEL